MGQLLASGIESCVCVCVCVFKIVLSTINRCFRWMEVTQ